MNSWRKLFRGFVVTSLPAVVVIMQQPWLTWAEAATASLRANLWTVCSIPHSSNLNCSFPLPPIVFGISCAFNYFGLFYIHRYVFLVNLAKFYLGGKKRTLTEMLLYTQHQIICLHHWSLIYICWLHKWMNKFPP